MPLTVEENTVLALWHPVRFFVLLAAIVCVIAIVTTRHGPARLVDFLVRTR